MDKESVLGCSQLSMSLLVWLTNGNKNEKDKDDDKDNDNDNDNDNLRH